MNFKFIHVHKLNYEIHYFQLHNLVCKSWLTLGKAYFVILRRNLLCTFSFLSVLGTLDAHGRSFNQNPSGKISMLATQCAICNNMSNIRTVFLYVTFYFYYFLFQTIIELDFFAKYNKNQHQKDIHGFCGHIYVFRMYLILVPIINVFLMV